MKYTVATFLSLLSVASAGVVSLTPENYDIATAGKVVFIKFFAPWCGHCKAMAGDWETLASDFESAADTLIAEVDCDNEINQPICSDNGIQGFPTLKHGNPSALEDYDGGRDYDSLKAFATDNLKPSCSAFNLDLCEGDDKARIEALMNAPEEELQAKTDAVDELVGKADEDFEEAIEKLQEQYMKMMEEHEAGKEAAKKESNYKEIKAVLAFKKSQGKNDEL